MKTIKAVLIVLLITWFDVFLCRVLHLSIGMMALISANSALYQLPKRK